MQAEIPVFKLRRGKGALVVSMPHVGTYIPRWLLPRLAPEAHLLADTDWYLESLYDFLDELDATVLVATHSRYVIDLNRPPDNASLYPGRSTTALCPLDSFGERPLYLAGCAPEAPEVEARIDRYWRPYHDALAGELHRVRAANGQAVLWDAHSIRSVVPRFFDGELPHLNIGSADNLSCDPALTRAIAEAAAESPYSAVVNGRFKGGYITRQYGNPGSHIHAIQLEIAMRSYMRESPPYLPDDALATAFRPTLRRMLRAARDWANRSVDE
ncbi:N-formylglutamate deformylase [Methylophilaceae bacterium]|nr:N-formylglutamate deformylase [Methylophilaceae bacterium]